LEDHKLPLSTTQGELKHLQQRRADLDRRLHQVRIATATLDALPDDPDPVWRVHLEAWRQTLCDELLALPARVRDPHARGLQINLTLSIKCIDFGPAVFDNTTYDVISSRLGQLMRAAGFEPQGADPQANFGGIMPWFGSLRDLDHAAQDVPRRRAQAEAALAEALLDDDAREAQEAEATALRDALNSMRIKNSLDPNESGVYVVVDRAGTPIDETTLTPAQQRALAQFRAGSRGESVTR
jgi:hypothetical protein